MITALSWIPKGASKVMPDAAESPSMKKIKELIHIGTFKKSLTDMDEEEEMDDEIQNSEVTHAKSVAKSFGKPCSKSKDASSSSTDADDVVKFLKELDMDNYDEEDDGIYRLNCGLGDLYYPSNEMDPYLKDTDANYDSEELDDITIRPTDSLIIYTTIKDDVNYLEVYVYEDSGNGTQTCILVITSLYPRFHCAQHGLIVLSKEGKRNFVAIGSKVALGKDSSIIEIWDLDLVNEVLPCVQIGRIAGQTSDCHIDSVIGLAWNKEFRNIVASASADKKVRFGMWLQGYARSVWSIKKRRFKRSHGTTMLQKYSSVGLVIAL